MFLSPFPSELAASKALIEKCILAEGQLVLGWREVPVNNAGLGESVKPTEPKSFRYLSAVAPIAPIRTPLSAS